MCHFMNSEVNIKEDLRTVFINCQMLSLLKLLIPIPISEYFHHDECLKTLKHVE